MFSKRVENTVERREIACKEQTVFSRLVQQTCKNKRLLGKGLILPNDKILDWSKLKTFADDKINVNHKLKFDMGRVEKIVGKGENAGYQHFLLFPQYFQNEAFFFRKIKNQDCAVKG